MEEASCKILLFYFIIVRRSRTTVPDACAPFWCDCVYVQERLRTVAGVCQKQAGPGRIAAHQRTSNRSCLHFEHIQQDILIVWWSPCQITFDSFRAIRRIRRAESTWLGFGYLYKYRWRPTTTGIMPAKYYRFSFPFFYYSLFKFIFFSSSFFICANTYCWSWNTQRTHRDMLCVPWRKRDEKIWQGDRAPSENKIQNINSH